MRGKMSKRDRLWSTVFAVVMRRARRLAPSPESEKYTGLPKSGLSPRWKVTLGVPPFTVDCVVP